MQNNPTDDLTAIRSIMENRTRFLSLSGLSGILAGIYALIGAAIAHRIVHTSSNIVYRSVQDKIYSKEAIQLFTVASIVLIAAITTGLFFSYKRSKAQKVPLWSNSSKRLVYSLVVPLIAGGIFILFLINRGDLHLIGASSLIFYGLALFSAGNFTFSDIQHLGIVEIMLGLIALFFPGHGLFLWAIGFGVLHIIYGMLMYFKYEK